jgi:hypothetical protein
VNWKLLKKSVNWNEAKVTTASHMEPKGLKFPKEGLDVVNPVIVRKKQLPNKPKEPTIVAPGSRDPAGTAEGIIVSSSMLDKLDCKPGEQVEYKKANVWDVLWAKKPVVFFAILGFVLAAAQAIAGLASLIPTSDRHAELKLAWGCVIIILFCAFLVMGITIWLARSND